MRERRIALKLGPWVYYPRDLIAKGGFGQVFSGTSPEGTSVAIKQLDATGLGLDQREMRIADEVVGHSHPHVIPERVNRRETPRVGV